MRIPRILSTVTFLIVLTFPGAPPVARAAVSPTPLPHAWLGDWKGVLDAGGQQLRLVIHISRHPDGSLAGVLDDPDQGSTGMPIDSLWTSGDTLRAMILHGGAVYVGALDAASNRIRGRWSQSGLSLPLDLGREVPSRRERPQDPVLPLPYSADDTTVTNPPAHVRLACTLTTPPGRGPFPAVLLITGSGAQDRDESMVGHRPFLVLADHLTRHGFVVMRCDDRGTGGSTGVFEGATTADFVADARAELASLRSRPNVDKRRVGLIGHSEGALIAPWIAASDRNVAFIVMLAGPGVPGDSLTVLQVEALLRASGASDSAIAAQSRFQRQLLERVMAGGDSSAMARDLGEAIAIHLRAQPGVDSAAVGGLVASGTQKVLSPWYRAFIAHDPRPDLRRTRCPVLAMNGSLDVQMPPAQNLQAVAQALRVGGNRDVRATEMPGLNHLFQTAKTGLMAEYGTIDETFAPAALDTLTAWLVAHTRTRSPEEPTRTAKHSRGNGGGQRGTSAESAAQPSSAATFIVLQGRDTVSVEQFTRAGNTITGVWIANNGQVQVHDYVLTLDPDGQPLRYDLAVSFPDGAGHLPPTEAKYVLEFGGDSLTLTTGRASPVTRRVAMKGGTYPSVGWSVLDRELRLTRLRAAHADSGDFAFTQISGGRTAPAQVVPVRFIGADSAIAGTTRYKVDEAGQVLGWRLASGEEARRVQPIDVKTYEAALIAADAQAEAAARTKLITLPASALDRLVGNYVLNANVTLAVARDNNRLTLRNGARPAADLLAHSATLFSIGRAVSGQMIEFETDSTGNATALTILAPGGIKQRVPKVAQ